MLAHMDSYFQMSVHLTDKDFKDLQRRGEIEGEMTLSEPDREFETVPLHILKTKENRIFADHVNPDTSCERYELHVTPHMMRTMSRGRVTGDTYIGNNFFLRIVYIGLEKAF